MKPPRVHDLTCFCADCKVRRDTRRRIAGAEKMGAVRAAGVPSPDAAVAGRRERRRLEVRAQLAAEVIYTDRRVQELRRTRERIENDRRGARFLELRRLGKTADEAHAIIDKELPDATEKQAIPRHFTETDQD